MSEVNGVRYPFPLEEAILSFLCSIEASSLDRASRALHCACVLCLSSAPLGPRSRAIFSRRARTHLAPLLSAWAWVQRRRGWQPQARLELREATVSLNILAVAGDAIGKRDA